MILRAFDLGILQLTDADLNDPAVMMRIFFAVRAVQDQDHKYLLQLRMMQHLAVADYNADNDQFSHHWNAANDLMDSIITVLQPWAAADKVSRAQRLAMLYREMIGDPNDPELKRKQELLRQQWKRDYEEIYGESNSG